MKLWKNLSRLVITLAALILLTTQQVGAQESSASDESIGFWNGFNEQINVVECSNLLDEDLILQIRVTTNEGSLLGERAIAMPPRGTVHTVLNEYPIANNHGTYTLTAANGSKDYFCFTAFYRESLDGADKPLEYAYALPLPEAVQGPSYGIFNSANPALESQPVFNWITVYNDGDEPLNATVDVFNLDGTPDISAGFVVNNLPPKSRRDFPIGHDRGQRIGTYVITPTNASAPYIAFLIRYSSNGEGFDFAFPLFAKKGTCEPTYVPISSMDPATNYLEVGNVGNSTASVAIELKSQTGEIVLDRTVAVAPFSQVHLWVNEFLGERNVGLAKVSCSNPLASNTELLVQSLYYGHRVPGDPSVEWAYASQAKPLSENSSNSLAFSVNTFLGAFNWAKFLDGGGGSSNIDFLIFGQAGALMETGALSLSSGGFRDLGLHESVGSDFVGYNLSTPNEGAVLASVENLRVYPLTSGGIGTIMNVPTLLVGKDLPIPGDDAICGNGVLEVGEVCDCGLDGSCGTTDDLVGTNSCISLGHDLGDLRCGESCGGFEIQECVDSENVIFVDLELSPSFGGPGNCSGNYDPDLRTCTAGGVFNAYYNPQEAANIVNPGQTVYIRSGTYTCVPLGDNDCVGQNGIFDIVRGGLPGQLVTFTNYLNERPVFDAFTADGTGNRYAIINYGDYVTLRGIEAKNSWKDGIRSFNANHFTVDDVISHHNSQQDLLGGGLGFRGGVRIDGGDFVTITNSEFYKNGIGIAFYEAVSEDASRYSSDCVVTNNFSYQNNHSLNFGNSSGIALRFVHRCQINNNVAYLNPDGAILGVGVTSSSHFNNILFHNLLLPPEGSGISHGNSHAIKNGVRGGGGNFYFGNLILGPSYRLYDGAESIGVIMVNNVAYGAVFRPQSNTGGTGTGFYGDLMSASFVFNNLATNNAAFQNNLSGDFVARSFGLATLDSDNNFWSDMGDSLPDTSPFDPLPPYDDQEPNSLAGDPKLSDPSLVTMNDANGDGVFRPMELFGDEDGDGRISHREIANQLGARFQLAGDSPARGAGLSHQEIENIVSSHAGNVINRIDEKILENMTEFPGCVAVSECNSLPPVPPRGGWRCFRGACVGRNVQQEVIKLEVLKDEIQTNGFHFLENDEELMDPLGTPIPNNSSPNMGVFQ